MGIHLPRQETRVRTVVQEDPTCYRQLSLGTTTTDPVPYSLNATAVSLHAVEPVLQQEKQPQ